MKMFAVPLAAAGFVALWCGMAVAASPAWCALYARAYAGQVVGQEAVAATVASAQDRAYYYCLNQDAVPELPTRSSYVEEGPMSDVQARSIWQYMRANDMTAMSFDECLTTLGVDLRDGQAVDEPDEAVGGKATTASAEMSSPETRIGRSRRTPWTAEWVAWCSSHYPNSFNPETGMIVPLDTLVPEFC
jgi:hypothetical protein